MLENHTCKFNHNEKLTLNECRDDSGIRCMYRHKLITKDNVRCVACFEIKISIEDFHSPHGHNLIGNLNYYIVPKDIYNTISKEILDNIGIIVYEEHSDRFLIKKDAKYQEISESSYNWFLQSIVNKITKKTSKYIYSLENSIGELNSKLYYILCKLKNCKEINSYYEIDDIINYLEKYIHNEEFLF